MELVWLSLHWLKDGLEAPAAMVLAERAAGADGGGSEPGWLPPRAAKPAGC